MLGKEGQDSLLPPLGPFASVLLGCDPSMKLREHGQSHWVLRLGVPPATFSVLPVAGSGFEGCGVERLKKSVRSNGAKELIFIMGLLCVRHCTRYSISVISLHSLSNLQP